jgi:hypothetical protein
LLVRCSGNDQSSSDAGTASGGDGSSEGGSSGSGSSGGSSGSSGSGSSSGSSSSGGSGSEGGLHDAGTTIVDAVAPTPPGQWAPVTNNLTGMSSECGNVGGVFPDPHADFLVVGIALEGLWGSTDGAKTWQALGKSGGDAIKNRETFVVFDPDNANTFWESGIYGWETGTDGVFLTTDLGSSFKGYAGLVTTSNGGNTDDSVSIDFSDPSRKTMLAGTHETANTVYLSTNAGTTWSNVGSALPAGLGFCTATLVVDSTTLLVGCAASWSGKAGAIVRSTNTGGTFTSVYSKGVSGQPVWASDGAIYWAEEGGGIVMSTDQGQNWTEIANSSAAGTLRPFELPDGRIVSAQGQNVVIAAPHGTSWTKIGQPMPFAANSLSYSPFRNAFFISYFTCTGSNAVPADAIQEMGWDYRTSGDGGP